MSPEAPPPDDAPPVVRLTAAEMHVAGMVGVMRQVAALEAGLRDRHGARPENGFKIHIHGACGEFAVAKLLGVYFPLTVNTFKHGADVGSEWQVRTRTEGWHELIVRASDRDSDRFVLVIGVPPEFTIHGWILGRDAKQPCWKQNHGERGAAWFVPKEALRPLPVGAA